MMKWSNNASRRNKENQRKMEAELQYRQMQRQLLRCTSTLEKLCAERKRAAYAAEKAGRHAAALREAHFIRNLETMGQRIGDLRMRMEIMSSMQGVSDTMNQFMTVCSGLSPMLQGLFDPAKLVSGQADFEKMMARIDDVIERSDWILEDIGSDTTLSAPGGKDEEETLNHIMRERDSEVRRQQLYDDQHRAISATDARLNERLRQLNVAPN